MTGGQKLRALRETLGYTMRDVETGSLQISRRLGNDEFAIPPSRLSDIETKEVVPSIFRLYTLAAIYRCDYRELLSWYGVDLNSIHADLFSARPNRSHFSQAPDSVTMAPVPHRVVPAITVSNTPAITTTIQQR